MAVGHRVIARREDPHPGAQFTFTDIEGHRFQCFMCDSTDADIAYLEARHRGHARVENRIRAAKDLGLRNLPFCDFAANAAWVEPRTCSPGPAASAWRESWPEPSPSGCATPCGT